MPDHVFHSGDCLFTIADKEGFDSVDLIWKHSKNKDLTSTREPGMLADGDKVFIPPARVKTLDLATGQRHPFTVKSVPAYLRLCLKDGDGQPMADQPYQLKIGSILRDGSTDGDGILEEKIPLPARSIVLSFAGRKLELGTSRLRPFIGEKHPDVHAAQARLRNLGYEPGPLDGIAGKRTRSAVIAFQVVEGLKVTGKIDDATIDKLKEAYGR
jgi:N-acetylmuramoyl-L-alanine amidase